MNYPSKTGSPPRAWGIPAGSAGGIGTERFTPTCVGNTIDSIACGCAPTVHPHVRGEYLLALLAKTLQVRFTPTCVGNTPYRYPSWLCVGSPPRAWGIRTVRGGNAKQESVHPHVRGEYGLAVVFVVVGKGSPPRAWGIRCSRQDHQIRGRFTPTCVGNTELRRVRVRKRAGSPPRAWGIRIRPFMGDAPSRFTPTCVGNTMRRSCSSTSPPVHPHVRGEY